ncbi:MAG: phage holin family protein [Candidatus Phytoplasma sp.]|nr:phage holin family protein [Phytoplasma sp.]
MKDDKNNQDENQLTEEDIKKLMDDLQNNKKTQKLIVQSFFNHPNMTISFLISYMVNLLVFASVSGILNQITPTIQLEWTSYFIGVTLFSLMEFVIKIVLLRFSLRWVIFSLGIIFLLTRIITLYLTSIIVPNFSFISVSGLLIFAISFTVIKSILKAYAKKYHIADYLRRGK